MKGNSNEVLTFARRECDRLLRSDDQRKNGIV